MKIDQIITNGYKSVTREGMTFRWKFEGAYLHCEVIAPTIGWVALGFNIRPGLEGTNLIMGCVKEQIVTVEDRYILGPGRHKSKKELGEPENLAGKGGWEANGQTGISFYVPQEPCVGYAYSLREGVSYHLLLAYSRADDFEHHSAMRTHLEITL